MGPLSKLFLSPKKYYNKVQYGMLSNEIKRIIKDLKRVYNASGIHFSHGYSEGGSGMSGGLFYAGEDESLHTFSVNGYGCSAAAYPFNSSPVYAAFLEERDITYFYNTETKTVYSIQFGYVPEMAKLDHPLLSRKEFLTWIKKYG